MTLSDAQYSIWAIEDCLWTWIYKASDSVGNPSLEFYPALDRLPNYSNYTHESVSLIYPPRFFIVFAHKDVIHPASISFDFVLVENFKTQLSTTWYLNSWSLSPGSSFSKIFFCFCKLFWWLILRLYMQPTCEYKDLSPCKCMHNFPQVDAL